MPCCISMALARGICRVAGGSRNVVGEALGLVGECCEGGGAVRVREPSSKAVGVVELADWMETPKRMGRGWEGNARMC